MKSYTDLEQSRVLAEILPLKSADMYYVRAYFENKQSDWFVKLGSPIKSDDILPCWSLAALLSVLPKINGLKPILDLEENSIQYGGIVLYVVADNPVDACIAMIEKLHELKML